MTKKADLQAALAQCVLDVVLLQETHRGLTDAALVVPGYTTYEILPKSASGKSGGVAILVRTPLVSAKAGSSTSGVHQAISATVLLIGGSQVKFTSAYFPHGDINEAALSSTTGADSDIHVLCGDFNVHHATWQQNISPSDLRNKHATRLADWAGDLDYVCANNPEIVTRFDPTATKRHTSPDVTFSRGAVVQNWRRATAQELPAIFSNSDHSPLLFTVSHVPPDLDDAGFPAEFVSAACTSRRPLFQWKKAQWPLFSKELRLTTGMAARRSAGYPSMSVDEKERWLSSRIRIATAHHVPRGNRNVTNTFNPNLVRSSEITAATERLNAATTKWQEATPAVPPAEQHRLQEEIQTLRTARNALLRDASSTRFREKCASLRGSDPHAWSAIRNMPVAKPTSRMSEPPQQQNVAAGPPPPTPKVKAASLIDMYANISTRHASSLPVPKRLRKVFIDRAASHRRPAASSSADGGVDDALDRQRQRQQQITVTEVRSAIRRANKGRAAGPDTIYADALHRLPSCTLRAITELCRHSLQAGTVPNNWRIAWIIPLLKPGKDAAKPESYRPVSLVSVLGKAMERIIYERMRAHLESFLTDTQSGFRAGRSTSDQLAHVFAFVKRHAVLRRDNQRQHNGGGRPTKVVATLVDFSRAFDKVDHRRLLLMMADQGIPHDIIMWVRHFLHERRARVNVDGIKSPWREMSCGVPQGTVLGPVLFLIYINSLARELEEQGIDAGLFADDLTILAHGTDETELESQINRALEIIDKWCSTHFMPVSAEKTKYISLVTPLSRDLRLSFAARDGVASPDVNASLIIGRESNTKLLGYQLDTRMQGVCHVTSLEETYNYRLSQLRAIQGRQWGPRATDLRTFYTGYSLGKILYGAETWGHLPSSELWQRLETKHNAGARIISGASQFARVSSVHEEANTVPLQSMATLRAFTYLEKCLRSGDGLRKQDAATLFDDQHPAVQLKHELQKKHQISFAESPIQLPTAADGVDAATAATPRYPAIAPPIAQPAALDFFSSKVKVFPHLISKLPRDATDEQKRAATIETINAPRLGRSDFRVWIDGAAHVGTRSGAAVIVQRRQPDGSYATLDRCSASVACGKLAGSMTAESTAWRLAMTTMRQVLRHEQQQQVRRERRTKARIRRAARDVLRPEMAKELACVLKTMRGLPRFVERHSHDVALLLLGDSRATTRRALHSDFDYIRSFSPQTVRHALSEAGLDARMFITRLKLSITFLSDSQHLLLSLAAGPLSTSDPIIAEGWEAARVIAHHCQRINMQHVRAHCGVEGNEAADALAELASRGPQAAAPLHMRDVTAAASRLMKERQLRAAEKDTHRFFVTGSSSPSNLSRSQHLPRKQEALLAQLRTDASHLLGTGLRRLQRVPAACRWCRACDHEQTAAPEEAPAGQAQRKKLPRATQHRIKCTITNCGDSTERILLRAMEHVVKAHKKEDGTPFSENEAYVALGYAADPTQRRLDAARKTQLTKRARAAAEPTEEEATTATQASTGPATNEAGATVNTGGAGGGVNDDDVAPAKQRFVCTFCSRECKSKQGLGQHVTKAHGTTKEVIDERRRADQAADAEMERRSQEAIERPEETMLHVVCVCPALQRLRDEFGLDGNSREVWWGGKTAEFVTAALALLTDQDAPRLDEEQGPSAGQRRSRENAATAPELAGAATEGFPVEPGLAAGCAAAAVSTPPYALGWKRAVLLSCPGVSVAVPPTRAQGTAELGGVL